jgi:hypothetical protein
MKGASAAEQIEREVLGVRRRVLELSTLRLSRC